MDPFPYLLKMLIKVCWQTVTIDQYLENQTLSNIKLPIWLMNAMFFFIGGFSDRLLFVFAMIMEIRECVWPNWG